MDIKEVRKIVGGIKASLFKNSNSFSIGMLKSHFKGTGLQFKEHQVYNHGDDVRFIDWKMLAKTSNPYIKTFEEERNIEIAVVIDANASMFNGYKGVSKLQAAFEICCLLYLLAEETGDFVHVLVISDEIVNIPKKNGDEGIVALLSGLEKASLINEKGRIALNYPLEREESKEEFRKSAIMRHLTHKREVVLISDFVNFLDKGELTKMLMRSNLHCFQILSPLDLSDKLPFSVVSKSSQKSNKIKIIDSPSKGTMFKNYGKKVKQLNVHERYLEEFVKEML